MKSTTRRFHETSRCIFSICLGEQWMNPPIIFRIVVYQNVLITIWINPHNQSPRQVDQPSLWWDLRWCIVWPQGRYNPSRNGTFARSSIPLVVWGPSHCQAQTPHFHSPEGVWNWQNFQVEDEKYEKARLMEWPTKWIQMTHALRFSGMQTAVLEYQVCMMNGDV